MFQAIYKLTSQVFATRAPAYLHKRVELGKEDSERLSERYGIASQPRPEGTLLWIHAASVGEARSVLALIHTLLEKHLTWNILVTTGTLSSAKIIAAELPANAMHQYMPLDVPAWVKAFLDHWKPDAVVWVEQEIWPNMLKEIHTRGIPAVLANGRLTESSFKRWLWIKSMARDLLAPFKRIYAQSMYDAGRLAKLSGHEVLVKGNLKYAAEPLPFNPVLLDTLRKEIGNRPIWMASSTHMGEEYAIAEAHKIVLDARPDALLIIVPRHPDRGEQITHDLEELGFHTARRSLNEPVLADTQVYLADTFSELGLFYRLCDIVFMGGSLMPVGGHNLIEPAQLECAVLYGPHMENFREIKELFERHNGSIPIKSAQELGDQVVALVNDPDRIIAMTDVLKALIAKEGEVLKCLINDVESFVGDAV